MGRFCKHYSNLSIFFADILQVLEKNNNMLSEIIQDFALILDGLCNF